MRSPEMRAGHRAGRTFEEELSLRYLSPGAFTVLSPADSGLAPDPPPAPAPYRLTPTNVRHKNQSFAILAEYSATNRPPPSDAVPDAGAAAAAVTSASGTNNRLQSRSPSPTTLGRVSPFRGRGFNPTGSRHASPNPSPPPHDDDDDSDDSEYDPSDHRRDDGGASSARYSSHDRLQQKQRRSQIPQLARRDSTTSVENGSPKFRRKTGGISKSMTNVAAATSTPQRTNRPPPSPRRFPLHPGYLQHGKGGSTVAFSRLSPIIGSSPEPSTAPEPRFPGYKPPPAATTSSSSSSSKIPRSRSQPHSRRQSPEPPPPAPPAKRPLNRNITGRQAKPNNSSRNASREPSPGPMSPTRIPVRSSSYRNVPAKVNSSFKANQSTSNNSSSNVNNNNSTRRSTKGTKAAPVQRTDSYRNRPMNRSNTNLNNGKTYSRSNSKTDVNAGKSDSNGNTTTRAPNRTGSQKKADTAEKIAKIPSKISEESETGSTTSSNRNQASNVVASKVSSSSTEDKTDSRAAAKPDVIPARIRKVESVPKLTDMLTPSAETVVATTTSTVTKPLKIETNLESAGAKPHKETPMYMDEGRVLSATSVSSALNRMNDTVLDSQTLMKGHNMSKLSPKATAIISMSQSATTNPINQAVPAVETTSTTTTSTATSSNPKATVQNNIGRLISPDDSFGTKVNHHVGDSVGMHEQLIEKRTIVGNQVQTEVVKPIRITVREKAPNDDVQSGNVTRLPASATNGVLGSQQSGLQLPQPAANNDHAASGNAAADSSTAASRVGCCGRLTSCCRKKSKSDSESSVTIAMPDDAPSKGGLSNLLSCCRKGKKLSGSGTTSDGVQEIVVSTVDTPTSTAPLTAKPTFIDRLKRSCCWWRRQRQISDGGESGADGGTGCCPKWGKRKASWAERRDSILSDLPPQSCCKRFWRSLFCLDRACCKCGKKPPMVIQGHQGSVSRRTSLVSKKKSLTPTVLPPEEPKDKIDMSLVEHTSTMKGAIPVLPVALAYICLVFNCIAPGTGTVFSGLFCLCMGKPRFSQKDGAKQRMGSFLINLIIGCGQCFTVLFCLVGWGWSIWWGCIMLKIAKKNRKIKLIEAAEEARAAAAAALPVAEANGNGANGNGNGNGGGLGTRLTGGAANGASRERTGGASS